MLKTLQEVWSELSKAGYSSDKGDIHSYLPVYEKVLAPYRQTAKNVLEIGLFKGDSLRMWEQYFTSANVYGIDCDEQPHGGLADLRPMIAQGTHKIFIGDATSQVDIEKFFKGVKFDFVCEDAAHNIEQELQIYKTIKPYLNKGAIYVIEDIQNLDESIEIFENIDDEKRVEIIDLRNKKGRYDDVLVLITDK